MIFKKLTPRNRHFLIAQQIMEAFQNGTYQVGDKLPTEQEIAKQMSVSRHSVREALSAFQLAGLIEKKVGDGTYVREVGTNLQSRVLAVLADNESPTELLEARMVLEGAAMRFAVDKSTQQDMEDIDRILTKMHEALDNDDYRGYLKEHWNFHKTVAKATGNSVIEKTINLLLSGGSEKLLQEIEENYYLPNQPEYLNDSFELHYRIFLGIKNGERDSLDELIQEHFERELQK